MGYCTPSDVSALNKAMVIGVGQNPTFADLQTYIDLSAGEIDAILLEKGWEVPVNTASWPEAGALLRTINARGGQALMEESAPASRNIDRAQKAWEDAKQMLSSSTFTIDADIEPRRAQVRGPYVTYRPSSRVYRPERHEDGYGDGDGCGDRALPYFNRGIEF